MVKKGRLRVLFETRYKSFDNTHVLWVDISGAKNGGFQYGAYRESRTGVERLGWDGRFDFHFEDASLEEILEQEKKSIIEQYKNRGYDAYLGRKKRT